MNASLTACMIAVRYSQSPTCNENRNDTHRRYQLFRFSSAAASSPGIGQLVALSVALVVVTIAFESVIGRFVDHKSWRQLLDRYAIWKGELWPVVLL